MSWAGLAARVAARPWRWAVGSTLLLAIIAVPALSLQLGVASDGERAVGSERRIGHDLLVEQQGAGAAAPLTVAVEVTGDPVVDPTTDPRVTAALGALAEVDGVVSVGAPRAVSPSVVRTSVITEYDASDPLLGSTLRAAREVAVPDGVFVHVGGSVAVLTDLSDRIGERLGWLVLGTVTVASLLLWLAFGAPGVALKAAAMDLVSVAAAYGVVVAVFQWGWGVSLLGLDGPVAIEAHVPMMLFAVLFGLSMDYEVFLLSAVAEHRRAGAAARAAVVAGVAETAKVITAAAAIMVAVFCAFVLVDDPTIKVFGVGLAAAVAIDATVVRVLLGPAVMSIAGERLWWSRRRPRQAEVVTPVVEPDSVVV